MQTGMQQGIIQFTTIDLCVLQSHELLGLECAIGDIVKIQTVGLADGYCWKKLLTMLLMTTHKIVRLLENKTAQYN